MEDTIVQDLIRMFDEINLIAMSFRSVRERFSQKQYEQIRLRLYVGRPSDENQYNMPVTS